MKKILSKYAAFAILLMGCSNILLGMDDYGGGMVPVIVAPAQVSDEEEKQPQPIAADQQREPNKLAESLALAISNGNDKSVAELLGVGADPDGISEGRSMLLLTFETLPPAIANKIAKLLIQNKADVNKKSFKDSTALKFAAKQKNPAGIKMLVDADANVNAIDQEHRTALFFAIEGGHEENVQALLDCNIDATIAKNDGTTPLQKAAEKGGKTKDVKMKPKYAAMIKMIKEKIAPN